MVLGKRAFPFAHRLLDLASAAHRLNGARELDQQAVAGGFNDAAAMLGDLGINQFAPMCLQPRKRPFLIRTHEPAVTRDIRGKNGGQLAFDAFRGQSGALQPHRPNRSSALSASYP